MAAALPDGRPADFHARHACILEALRTLGPGWHPASAIESALGWPERTACGSLQVLRREGFVETKPDPSAHINLWRLILR